jgi:hypothetical protein
MLSLESLDVAQTALSSLGLWGYLDPGSGSMAFQLLLAGLLSTSFFLRSWAKHLRDGLRLRFRKS